jgi:hypothetical protein
METGEIARAYSNLTKKEPAMPESGTCTMHFSMNFAILTTLKSS